MKKVGAFLLILLCVLTCVVTTLGDYLYGAVFGQTNEETAGTQYALSMDENGIVYYIENVDGANHIVKVDDQGNLIVDEELPVLTDADRFVVQNIYVTSDNYIYVAGFEMDLVNRQASRAILIALDENGSLYATPYDRTIVPEGVRAPRDGAMFAAMSEDDDRVYFAYLNEGQAEVLAHEKSDGSVTTLSYVDAGGEITAMYVTAEGRLVTAAAPLLRRRRAHGGAGRGPGLHLPHVPRQREHVLLFERADRGRGPGEPGAGQRRRHRLRGDGLGRRPRVFGLCRGGRGRARTACRHALRRGLCGLHRQRVAHDAEPDRAPVEL